MLRYSMQEKRRIKEAIGQLLDQGLDHDSVTKEMNESPIKPINGGQWSRSAISSFIARNMPAHRRRKRRTKMKNRQAPPGESWLAGLMKDQSITDHQKLGVAPILKDRFPPAIQMVLDDDNIPEDSKVRIMGALGHF